MISGIFIDVITSQHFLQGPELNLLFFLIFLNFSWYFILLIVKAIVDIFDIGFRDPLLYQNGIVKDVGFSVLLWMFGFVAIWFQVVSEILCYQDHYWPQLFVDDFNLSFLHGVILDVYFIVQNLFQLFICHEFAQIILIQIIGWDFFGPTDGINF